MQQTKSMRRNSLSSLLLLLTLTTGCSSDDAGADSSGAGGSGTAGSGTGGGGSANELSGSLEVVTFWGTEGGDFAAIENASNAFTERHPGVELQLTQVADGWAGLDENIETRLMKGLEMPDVFQKASDESLLKWNANGDVYDLTELYAQPEPEAEGGNAWQDVIPEALLGRHRFDGHLLSLGVNLHRTNGIFYNKKLFEQHDLSPPKTIEDLKNLVVKLKSDVDLNGGAPMIIGNLYEWTFSVFVFSCLGPHVMGPDEYRDYLNGDLSPENAKFEELLDLVLFLRCGPDPANECDGYFNPDIDELDHLPSIEAFVDGFEDGNPKYAMTQAGDWVKQWMKDGGLEPGVDFDVFVCPVANEGDTPVFTGGADSFSMMSAAPNPEAALAYMKFLGSKEGQLAINQEKGAIPIRNDIDLAQYPDIFDALQVKTYTDFQNHRYFIDGWAPGALPNMMSELKLSIQAGTTEIAYNYVKNNYSTLKGE